MIERKKLRLGLLGKDVSKSDSERIHIFILKQWGIDCEYERFSVDSDGLDWAMRRLLGDFDGFNITIPYKRDAMEYLDNIVGDAVEYSAVNTVLNATHTGYNTDGIGFLQMIRSVGMEYENKKILVLGGGGSGRSTAAALKKGGAEVFMYQRNRKKLEETCAQLGITAIENPEAGGYDVIINCTGVGMHDTEGKSPVTAKAFCGAEAAIDLIYVPRKSEFLRLAEEQGIKILNGASMLFFQAYYADCLYLDRMPNEREVKEFYGKYEKEYLLTEETL
ncbi:MAG: shikimate dehydrogenase [Clostridia bacterium]|nr:shikimate dehydrogenase [Clostridia bacterium]